MGETSEKMILCLYTVDRKRFQNIAAVHACRWLNEARIYCKIGRARFFFSLNSYFLFLCDFFLAFALCNNSLINIVVFYILNLQVSVKMKYQIFLILLNLQIPYFPTMPRSSCSYDTIHHLFIISLELFCYNWF